MKKLSSFTFAAAMCFSLGLSAQLPNYSLDTWVNKSATFGIPPVLPSETYNFQDPSGWSTSNQATNHSVLAGLSNVTEDTTVKYHGTSSARLETLPISVATFSFNVPGILVNGSFTIDASVLTGGLNPFSIPGTGTPVTGKPSRLVGYYNYLPAGSDTCQLSAALVDAERNIVAQAFIQSSTATGGFVQFTADFNYISCAAPDTMVIIIASSPFTSAPAGGSPGSVLWVDSIGYSYLPTVNVAPTAVDDSASTFKNAAIVIPVLSNDFDCEAGALTLGSASGASHGIAVAGTSDVTYTPNAGYVGWDNFTYNMCDAGPLCNSATVYVNVKAPVGIEENTQDVIAIYPNPAVDAVSINTNFAGTFKVELVDLNGKVIRNETHAVSKFTLNLDNIEAGFYFVRFSGVDGTFKGVSRLQVVH